MYDPLVELHKAAVAMFVPAAHDHHPKTRRLSRCRQPLKKHIRQHGAPLCIMIADDELAEMRRKWDAGGNVIHDEISAETRWQIWLDYQAAPRMQKRALLVTLAKRHHVKFFTMASIIEAQRHLAKYDQTHKPTASK